MDALDQLSSYFKRLLVRSDDLDSLGFPCFEFFKCCDHKIVCVSHWLVGRVLASGPGDLGPIPGRVIPKTLKMAHDTSLLNTQHYKVRIERKVEQSRERSSALLYTSV